MKTPDMDKENNFVLREAVKAAQMGYYDHLAAGGKQDPAEERWIEALEAGADAISKVHVLETRLAQVEKDLAFKEKCLEWRYNDIARAEDMIDDLNAKLAQVEKERDAAIHDLHRYCSTCKHDPRKEFNKMPCKLCMDNKIDGYEWRGVCPENSKEK